MTYHREHLYERFLINWPFSVRAFTAKRAVKSSLSDEKDRQDRRPLSKDNEDGRDGEAAKKGAFINVKQD